MLRAPRTELGEAAAGVGFAALPRLTAFFADGAHVFGVFADGESTFSARNSGFVGRELVSLAVLVRSFAAEAGDPFLLGGVHGRKAAAGRGGLGGVAWGRKLRVD